MRKKILTILASLLLIFVATLIIIPMFFQDKIGEIIKNKVNNNIDAQLNFASADLSLLGSFPNATVTIKDIALVNKVPFEGDTLFSAKDIELKMSIKELFKEADEPIGINSLTVDGALLNILVDADGNANYDIAKETEDESTSDTDETDASPFVFSMDSYAITNSTITYADIASGMALMLSDVQHDGTGDLSLEKSELNTRTKALVSFGMNGTNYLNENKVGLDAVIGIDLNENKYAFKKNIATVNKLPLVFDGFVKLNDDNQEVDINFKTLSTEFKNFLALIPEEYSKSIENITTSGNFTLVGNLNGIIDETHIPKFNVKLKSDNASFKYPDLPKSVKNIFINAVVNNSTGITEDTSVDIQKLSFNIDEDKFNATSKITNLMGNTKVKAHLDGKMNLANISKAYPVPADLKLKGLLNADVSTAFDMASLEKKQFDKTETSGTLNLKDFEYSSEEMANPVQINTTALTFNPKTVSLNEFSGKTGETDFSAKGTITNLLGFLFKDEDVEGNFNLTSNVFSLDDFMVEETGATTQTETIGETEEKLKIPSFLNANITADAKTVIYDNLTLKDVKGTLRVKDEKATLKDMTTSIFNGKMSFNGEVSTKTDVPAFAMNLGMDSFGIGEALKGLEMLEVLAPVAKLLRGKLNSDIQISGKLNDDFTPNLSTISGKVLAELISAELNPKRQKFMDAIGQKLSFLKSDKLNLKGLKTALSFEDGKVTVKPFKINYDDITMNVSGSHSFDRKLAYSATLEVPAKYLGKDITNLIAKIDDSKLENLTIPVTANIGGSYTSPQVKTDLTSGIKSLTAQLVEIEKQKLITKGKDKAKDLIGDVLKKNKIDLDSVNKKTGGSSILKDIAVGITGNKKTDSTAVKTDSTTTDKKEQQKDAIKNVLGGLFGKKKKKKEEVETEKDTIN